MVWSSKSRHILQGVKHKITRYVVVYVRSNDGSIMKKSYFTSKDEAKKLYKEVNDNKEDSGVWAYITLEVIG